MNNINSFPKFPFVEICGLAHQIGRCSPTGCNTSYFLPAIVPRYCCPARQAVRCTYTCIICL